MTEVTKLLRTPTPYPDESFKGYILRLTEENGYESPTWIHKMSKVKQGSFVSIFPSFSGSYNHVALSQITGTASEELTKLTFPLDVTNGGDKTYAVFGQCVPRYMIRTTQSKICPDCLREAAYMRKIWDVAPVTACPVHKRILVDECPACGRNISWNRNEVCVCKCGYDWRDIKTTSGYDDSEIGLSRHIHQICGLLSGTDLSEDNPLHSLNMEHMLKVIFLVAGTDKGVIDTKGKILATSLKNRELHYILTKSFAVFKDWPHQYFRYLDSLRKQDHKVSFSTGLRKDFGKFFTTLYHSSESRGYNFLRAGFEEYLITQWDGGHLSQRYRFLTKKALQTKKHVTAEIAASFLGIGKLWIPQLVEAGVLKGIIRDMGKRKLCLVEKDGLDHLRRERENALSLDAAAAQLEIGRHSLVALVQAGYIKTLRWPKIDLVGWKFNDSEIYDFLKKIRSKIIPRPPTTTSNRINLLDAIRYFSRYQMNMCTFVNAILNDEIIPCGHNPKKGIAGFYFDKKHLKEYLRVKKIEQRGEKLYSVPDAAKKFGLKQEVVYFLVRKGLITTEQKTIHHRQCSYITEEAVEKFKATYVTISDLAKMMGTSPKSLVESLMGEGIMPVSGPSIDGGRQYVFRRSDLERTC